MEYKAAAGSSKGQLAITGHIRPCSAYAYGREQFTNSVIKACLWHFTYTWGCGSQPWPLRAGAMCSALLSVWASAAVKRWMWILLQDLLQKVMQKSECDTRSTGNTDKRRSWLLKEDVCRGWCAGWRGRGSGKNQIKKAWFRARPFFK